MRLSKFEDAIVRGNARYFRDQGFINDDLHRRVLDWLDGAEDPEVQKAVISWMESDAEWIASIEPRAMERFWYVAPAIKLESILIRRILLSRVKELKGETAGGAKGLCQLLPMEPDEGPPLPRFLNIRWPE